MDWCAYRCAASVDRSRPAGIALALRVSRGHKQVSRVRLGLGLMMVISGATFGRNPTTVQEVNVSRNPRRPPLVRER
jgi:hypothetical protein